MTRFILLTFGVLAWTFYELSGGADFEPRGYVADNVDPLAPVQLADTRSQTPLPEVTRAEPLLARADDDKSERSGDAADARATATLQPVVAAPTQEVAETEGETPPPVTLVSLQESATLFAQPVGTLETTTAANTIAEAAQDDIRAVAGSRVNMRNGPGTRFSVITSLVRGSEVKVIDEAENGWVKLRLIDGGQVGWMAGRFLTDAAG